MEHWVSCTVEHCCLLLTLQTLSLTVLHCSSLTVVHWFSYTVVQAGAAAAPYPEDAEDAPDDPPDDPPEEIPRNPPNDGDPP